MGRPVKKGLNYFNIDCIQEDNLNYVEAKHGLLGYAILVKLWRKAYMVEGYFMEWAEKNKYLFAREVGTDIQIINEVVETCLDENIFSREMFDKYSILTSHGIQNRYLKIVTLANRKESAIDAKFNLLTFPEEEIQNYPWFPGEETPIDSGTNPEESTQKKVKELKESKGIKEEKINNKKIADVDTSATGEPAKISGKKEKPEEPPTLFWQPLVDVWFNFNFQKFNGWPSFAGTDPKILKRILARLQKRAEDQGHVWTEELAIARFTKLLNACFADPWLKQNFLLSNIEKQFDKFILNQSNGKTTNGHTGGNRRENGAVSLINELREELGSGQ